MPEELNILPKVGETEPSDEVKRLMCLEFATRNQNCIDPVRVAADMYKWVIEAPQRSNKTKRDSGELQQFLDEKHAEQMKHVKIPGEN